jgi:ubiquinone/menaquinone biosynthesis C-methylase UbiE
MLTTDYSNYKTKNLLEAEKRIIERWKKNKIKFSFKKNDKILVHGTLNYSKAILNLGSKNIFAVDNCKKPWFYKTKKYSSIKYKSANLNYNLNFKSQSIKFIFCNGILSHLKNWERVLENFYKILEPGGYLWINVYEDNVYRRWPISLQKKINNNDREVIKKILLLSKWDAGKIKYILESFFWQERIIFNRKKLEDKIKKIGFKKIIFCKRGCKNDLNEMIYKNKRLSKTYGSGDLRYLITK